MAGETAIEWTDRSWNPIVGCSVVSPGCTNCYAMRMAARIEAMAGDPMSSDAYRRASGSHYDGTTRRSKAGAVWTGKVAMAPESVILAPLRRRKPTTWFVNSMGDLFHESVPDAWIDRVFTVMALSPQHTYQVLTKRSARMRSYFSDRNAYGRERSEAVSVMAAVMIMEGLIPPCRAVTLPLPNVWLGVSAEDQRRADERVPDLLATPAAVRFVSAEPLLGRIDFDQIIPNPMIYNAIHGMDRLLNWIIVGGESGPGARPMHPDWARSIRDQCAAAGVPFFFKQWGEWLPGQNDIYPGGGPNPASMGTAPRRVAHWQDGGWGPRDVSRNMLSRNYAMWDAAGVLRSGDARIAGSEHFEVAAWAQRVGKKRAGRLLDGALHDAMPVRP